MSSSNANSLPNLLSIAQLTGLGGYLNGTITAPPSPPTAPNATPATPVATPINSHNPSIGEWDCNGCLAGIIYQNIKDPRSIRVTQDMSSNAMWTRLRDEYETMSAATQTLTKECIQQYKYVPSTPFKDYFKQLEALCKMASNVGCTITDDDLHSHFLTSLSTEHLWILQTHGAQSYADLKQALVEYNMMVESANGTSNNATAHNALAVTGRNNPSIICDNCKCVGYVKKNCWAHGGGSKGKALHWYNAPKGMEPLRSNSNPLSAFLTTTVDTSTAAAAVYNFSTYKPGDWDEKLLPF
ncbi:hypothetical protein GYMLUDRAFT_240498 [Collybiopsis luxurians FD-317 M1]|nr:hypothetical protein GYMLUDRAFT_240498 [Collybiopsis luxurians FD-317 M1]